MRAEVIVVGAGPAGLALAGELRLAGVEVVVLERSPTRSGESRGLGFTAGTMAAFDQRGLLARFGTIDLSDQGHFGGLPVDFGVLGAHQAAKTIPQHVTEKVLEQWAVELGADIRRGREVVAVRQHDDHVAVEVAEFDGTGPTEWLSADYVVGCDGGRSRVRKLEGFDFPGTSATMEMFLADVRGVNLEPRMIGETLPGGMVMVGPLPGGITRLIVCERGTPPRRRTSPPEFSEVAQAWKRLTGDDISDAEPVWVSSFGDAARLATEYRRGRVFLAGDAAHIHLPAGGQGMNTGIQDAVNLGWKLALTLRSAAPESLLDSYHHERHRVGQRLLLNTLTQGMLFLGGPEVQPMRDLFSELISYEVVAKHLAGMVSGLDIRYDVGGGNHPLLGKRVPPLAFTDGPVSSPAQALRAGRGVLLDFADRPRLRERAAAWGDRVDVLTVTVDPGATRARTAGLMPEDTSALLVRPDGYVAWAAPGSHCDLPTALRRWFGPGR